MTNINNNNNNDVIDNELLQFVQKYEELREKRRVWSKNYRNNNKDKVKIYSERYRAKQNELLQECKKRGLIVTKK